LAAAAEGASRHLCSQSKAKDFGSNPNSFHHIINSPMDNPFSKHPEEIGETYLQHLCFAGGIAWLAFQMALAALIHAFWPFLFQTTASERLKELNDKISNRRT